MERGNAIKNTGWLLAGSLARMVIQLAVGVISARYLGPTNYGTLNYVGSYISLFSIICELGLTITIVNEFVGKKDSDGTIIGSAVFMRSIAAAISTVLLVIITHITDPGDSVVFYVLIIRSLGLLFDSFNVINCWFQSKLQSKYTTIYELIAYIVSSAYKIIILIFHKNIFWFAAATTIDQLLIAVFYYYGFKTKSKSKISISLQVCKKLIKQGIPFIFSGIMVYIYGQTDRIMIGKMIDQTAVGFYSCAAQIGTMIGFIPMAIINSGKTLIMEQKSISEHGYNMRLRQTLAAVLWIMNFYAIFLMLFGKYVIWILYGKDYLNATAPLKVLIWSYGFSYVGTVRNIWLICEDKRKYATIFSAFGAFANITLNLLLIPILGIVGAALATLITQTITSLIAPSFFIQTRTFSKELVKALFLRDVQMKRLWSYGKNKIHNFLK